MRNCDISNNKNFGRIVLSDMLSVVNLQDLENIRKKYIDTVESIYKEICDNMNNKELRNESV